MNHAADSRLDILVLGPMATRRAKFAIDFQIRHDGPCVRKRILHFTTLADAPALIAGLR